MATRSIICMCVFLSVIGLNYGSTGTMIKYVNMKTETIRLSCPTKHVIFKPQLIGGVFNSNDTNCTGIPKGIKAHVDKCHFRKSCEIEIRRADSVLCHGRQRAIGFVKMAQPYCIPKDLIIDVGSNRTMKYQSHHGVIRSHKHFPLKSHNIPKRSLLRIPIPRSYTLYITYHTGKGRRLRDVTIFKKDGGKMTKIRLRHNKVGRYKFIGQGVKELVIETNFRKGGTSHGFVIPFAVYSYKSLRSLKTWPKQARPLMRAMGWIFEVKAVIVQCTVTSKGEMSLSCSDNKVIYSPALSESGYTRFEPKCIWKNYPCGGSSAEILVQKNSCYWRSTCNITWQGSSPIIVSRKSRCIGTQASTIGFSGHRCVEKSSIYDLCAQNCTGEMREVNANWGIVRSHSTYPWYFDTDISECKRIIKIGDGRVLLLVVQDLNLDPDGRDTITVIHALNENKRIIMDAKSASEGAHTEVQGGRLIIKFKPYEYSKSGRGFILVFRMTSRPMDSINSKANGNTDAQGFSTKGYRLNKRTLNIWKHEPDVVQDEGHKGRIRLSNRRLCSGTRHHRKRGRACAPRVWTDYFTRLE